MTGDSRDLLILAHGAGGKISDPFLTALTRTLAASGISGMRFNFLYSERGKKAPDRSQVLLDTWTAVFADAGSVGKRVWAGGRSMGGRYASLAAAQGMPAAGLIFLAYPLHAPGKHEKLRDEHLYGLDLPMLFIQGTRDAFARWDLLEKTVNKNGRRARLAPLEGADHSFRTPGRKTAVDELAQTVAQEISRFINTNV